MSIYKVHRILFYLFWKFFPVFFSGKKRPYWSQEYQCRNLSILKIYYVHIHSSHSNPNWWLFFAGSIDCVYICRLHMKMGDRVSSRPRRRFRITINRPRRWRYWYNGERLRAALQLGWTHTSLCNPSPFAYADFSVRLDLCSVRTSTRTLELCDDGVKHRSFSFPIASLVSSFLLWYLLASPSLFLPIGTDC